MRDRILSKFGTKLKTEIVFNQFLVRVPNVPQIKLRYIILQRQIRFMIDTGRVISLNFRGKG